VDILRNIPIEGIEGGTDTLADETTEEPHADSDQTAAYSFPYFTFGGVCSCVG
jgi:hypothetical protein